MSAQALTASMEKLLKLHKSLYELAVKKTEIVKQGDIESLNKFIQQEQVHITAIEKVEKERQAAVLRLLPQMENPTVTDCLSVLKGEEHHRLHELSDQLMETVFELKERNFLNQQMIYHSLQFVNFSMNLINPQPESYTYGPPTDKQNHSKITQGIFNSKA
ncbi:FlgN family protein [Bacillus methanolicus PB1]|uniref:FlgN family protein n=1 Tax=Bacillus methanolicus PB1 TaxID=997296 RepID=I3E1Z2_BACMT|nr:flagellar protein FlgN [Bacillus methanolicus]EIJ80513.1 FlgN family protein [Bacillus methanolicus PB1]